MCDIVWLPKLLVWSFVAAALVLAIVSRGLNDHLLVPPEQPSGPLAFLLRRKFHVKLGFLRDPTRHFDEAGQRSVKLFIPLLILAGVLFVALAAAVKGCGWAFGG